MFQWTVNLELSLGEMELRLPVTRLSTIDLELGFYNFSNEKSIKLNKLKLSRLARILFITITYTKDIISSFLRVFFLIQL